MQQPQQPTFSNVSIGTATQAKAAKALTQQVISRAMERVQKKGPNTYWQINNPGRDLKLNSAANYVTKNYAGNQGFNRFVYWPQYLVAGTISDIANNFRAAGVNVSEQQIQANSVDPLNPQHRAQLEAMAVKQPGGGGAAEKKTKHSLEEYIAIGEVIKGTKGGATTGTAKGATVGRGRAGQNPQGRQQAVIQNFNQVMAQALSLPQGSDVSKVINVTKFDASKFTGALSTDTPGQGPRVGFIRPILDLGNGRNFLVPVVAQPTGAGNFAAYVQSVIANSNYANYAQYIQRSFNEQLAAKSAAPVQPQQGFVQQPVFQVQQPAFQTQPFPGQGFVLPLATQPNISTQLGAVSPGGSPRSPFGAASPAPVSGPQGLALPVFGGGSLPSVQGLPQVGNQLPTIGTGSLPAFNLPTIGQGGVQFPSNLGSSPQF